MPRSTAKTAPSDENTKKRTRQEVAFDGEEDARASSTRSTSKRPNRSKATPSPSTNRELQETDPTQTSRSLPSADVFPGKVYPPVASKELNKNYAEDTMTSLPPTMADLPPSTVPMVKSSDTISSGSKENIKTDHIATQSSEDINSKTSSGRTDELLSSGLVEGAENSMPAAMKVQRNNLETLVFVFALLLSVATGACLSFGMSAQLAIGELRSNLQNCQALVSHSKAEDEHYIQELETQLRNWKQKSRLKDTELKVLRAECGIADEDE